MSETDPTTPLLSPRKLYNFWARIDKTAGPGACWLWSGARSRDGYGVLMVRRKHVRAHRVAWILCRGPIPDGLHVCHHCDVRNCCNPAHLFLGTNLENHRDAQAKGRKASGDRSGAGLWRERVARGEDNGNARLTTEIVRLMRQERAAGATLWEIAHRYQTTAATVSRICRREVWKHVE